MAWTTPKTWSAETLTSDDLNTYVRDNQTHLYTRLGNQTDYIADEVSDYSTTSTSFVDIDATNLALTITTNGGNVLVIFNCNPDPTAFIQFNVAVDGVDYFADDGGAFIHVTGTYGVLATPVWLIEGLSAGSHTFKMRFKVNSGTGIVYAGAGVANLNVHPQMIVMEL